MAQFGRARGSGLRSRRFKSCHADLFTVFLLLVAMLTAVFDIFAVSLDSPLCSFVQSALFFQNINISIGKYLRKFLNVLQNQNKKRNINLKQKKDSIV